MADERWRKADEAAAAAVAQEETQRARQAERNRQWLKEQEALLDDVPDAFEVMAADAGKEAAARRAAEKAAAAKQAAREQAERTAAEEVKRAFAEAAAKREAAAMAAVPSEAEVAAGSDTSRIVESDAGAEREERKKKRKAAAEAVGSTPSKQARSSAAATMGLMPGDESGDPNTAAEASGSDQEKSRRSENEDGSMGRSGAVEEEEASGGGDHAAKSKKAVQEKTALGKATAEPIAVGAQVNVKGSPCIVRFVGRTAFAEGEWVGVEFETACGRNDGSVDGEYYFRCPPNHGLFVQRSQVKQRKLPESARPLLPDGWSEVVHHAKARSYSTYHGPDGERAASRAAAWRTHEAAEGGAGASGRGREGVGCEGVGCEGVGARKKVAVADRLVEDSSDDDEDAISTGPQNAKAAGQEHGSSSAAPEADSSDDEAQAHPLIGKRLSVYWTAMRTWYAGEVMAATRERGRWIHELLYEADGVRMWHKLEGPGAVKWKEAKPK